MNAFASLNELKAKEVLSLRYALGIVTVVFYRNRIARYNNFNTNILLRISQPPLIGGITAISECALTVNNISLSSPMYSWLRASMQHFSMDDNSLKTWKTLLNFLSIFRSPKKSFMKRSRPSVLCSRWINPIWSTKSYAALPFNPKFLQFYQSKRKMIRNLPLWLTPFCHTWRRI